MNKVVVTGMGCVCAAGLSVDAAMRSMAAGKRAPAPPAGIKTDLKESYPVFEVPAGFQAGQETTRTLSLLLSALDEALGQAALSPGDQAKRNIGVAIGTTVGCTLNNEPFYRDFKANAEPDLAAVRLYLSSNPAHALARRFGWKGPVATVANACSSGTDAVGLAKSWIEHGWCEMAVAGGTDELSRITYLGFISLLNTSREPCRPFDRRRSGLNLGEGAGVLILETPENAAKRGQHALACIAGYGTAADAYHPTAPHPEGSGLKQAIRMAMRDAGVRPDELHFVNTHGTSTPENDRVEGRTLASFFPDPIPAVSTKSYTGHALGAAGALEAIFSVRALEEHWLPATLGFEEPDPECIIAPTTENLPLKADLALSTSLAFGGNNSALIIRRA